MASYAGSLASTARSSFRARHERAGGEGYGQSDGILDQRSSLEYGVFGVLFTLSKERSETRIRYRWAFLKILLDGWQLFSTVISPERQGWSIDAHGPAWAVVGVLNFTWLADLGYGAYLAVLYSMLALLAVNVVMCVWVAWCFKEHKFPVVWPIKVLRVFSSLFFQAFDVTSLNLLQLGFSCRFTGPLKPHLHFSLLPQYSCTASPHIVHAIVSALCLVLFVSIALLLNMAEVEVNPLCRRPLALGHSGADVWSFALKALLTLVNVFFGWRRVEASIYLALSLALAWLTLRWNSNLVAWMNYLKGGVSATTVWCSAVLMLLVFHSGSDPDETKKWADTMTLLMLTGLAPAFGAGALISWGVIRYKTNSALKALENPKELPLMDAFHSIDEPRDVELASRCCRVWKDSATPDPDAVKKAHQIIRAGVEMFPQSAYMALLHGNFMIDVLGISQSGGRRIEEARKLNPGLMCRFIMFVRQQQATQSAAESNVNSNSRMDLLGYVEYQSKQRMVVRLHREALQAMCSFWRALDASSVSFTHLSKALGRIERSVSQAQRAYQVVLESYGNNPKLVHLYGKFLQTVKNDPWHAAAYISESERLEELQAGQASGPLMPDGTPLSRMDDLAMAVLVVNWAGEVQMVNKHAPTLFGYKRGALEGMPLVGLFSPQFTQQITRRLGALAALHEGSSNSEEAEDPQEEMVVVALHYERLAFPAKLLLHKVTGVGEDSTIVAVVEPVPPAKGVANLWVTKSGLITACDGSFVAHFGWRASEVNGINIQALVSVGASSRREQRVDVATTAARGTEASTGATTTVMARLLSQATPTVAGASSSAAGSAGSLACSVPHKYTQAPVACEITLAAGSTASSGDKAPKTVYELWIKIAAEPVQPLAVNRKGHIMHASPELASLLLHGPEPDATSGPQYHGGLMSLPTVSSPTQDSLAGYTLMDFLPPAWRDMHSKVIRDMTPSSQKAVLPPACRRSALPGPTLELRSASGKELYMRVGVTTSELQGEVVHVVRLERASLESALAERRLRLRLSPDGLIAAVEAGDPSQLFGFETRKLVGRGLWEVVDELPFSAADNRPYTAGPRDVATFIDRSLAHPGHSWRVQITSPQPASGNPAGSSLGRPSQGAHQSKAAILQVELIRSSPPPAGAGQGTDSEGGNDRDDGSGGGGLFIDLWPVSSVVGALELDPFGRIRGVMEERTRPVGLLFGVPSQALVGSMLGEFVALPKGVMRTEELLIASAFKKSSLKARSRDASVKVGPVHVLRATHQDGRPLSLELQVVGKPGPNESATAILKVHQPPMMPWRPPPPQPQQPQMVMTGGAAAAGGVAAAAGSKMRAPALLTIEPECIRGPRFAGVGAHAPADATPPAAPHLFLSSQQQQQQQASAPANRYGSEPPPALRSLATPPAALASRAASRADLGGGGSPAEPPPPLSADFPASPLQPPSDGTPSSNTRSAPSEGAVMGLEGRSKLAEMVKSLGGEKHTGDGGGAVGLSAHGAFSRRLSPEAALESSPRATSDRQQTVTNRNGGEPATPDRTSVVPATSPMDCADVPGTVVTGYLPSKATDTLPPPNLNSEMVLFDAAADDDAVQEASIRDVADGRIYKWLASEGAFYQNSKNSDPYASNGLKSPPVGASDDGGGSGGPRVRASSGCELPTGGALAAVLRKDLLLSQPGDEDDEPDDDSKPLPPAGVAIGKGTAARRRDSMDSAEGDPATLAVDTDEFGSDGGQSAVSGAPSASGSEYTRGKRVRKLTKLMDSSEAQQVQRRLRVHALVTVGILAVAHIACFALTVLAIKVQRTAMLQLGNSVLAQQHMQRVIITVRSLDNIAAGKWHPNVYTPEDAPAFVTRVGYHAGEAMARINDILIEHSGASAVMDLLYKSRRLVWESNSANGSDVYVNLTTLDFGTRFYTMAKNIEQFHNSWVQRGVRIADTTPGQFLLKSGPDFFGEFRKVMDALLQTLVDSTRLVENQQIIFLVVEGAALSFIAACYLAYRLRAVAAQRYKLYSTFLIIPLGLTRALAAQNTNLSLDGEDDSDDDDDNDDNAVHASAARSPPLDTNAPDGSGDPSQKTKRQTKLKVQDAELPKLPISSASFGAAAATAWEGSFRPSAASRQQLQRGGAHAAGGTASAADLRARGGGADDHSGGGLRGGRRNPSLSSGDLAASSSSGSGCWGWMRTWRQLVWRGLAKRLRRRASIHPIPGLTSGALASFSEHGGGGKRRLVLDSHETAVMLLPFIVWSALVITIYSVAVAKLKGIDEVVALHSITNYMAARTSRSILFSQEVVSVDSPAQLPAKRAALAAAIKLLRDAWFTLQLGAEAYLSAGNDTERFPLVTKGLGGSSPELLELLYRTDNCHRTGENLPCPGPGDPFFKVIYSSLASIAQQHFMCLKALATSTSTISPGLQDDNFNFIYNVGYKDLLDGALSIKQAHFDTILAKFDVIMLLHIILFLLFWIIVAGFLVLQLNPLLRRIAEERRRVAELMSQLPLELDVERLVARALGPPSNGAASDGDISAHGRSDADGTSKWKAIIKASGGSSTNGRASSMDGGSYKKKA